LIISRTTFYLISDLLWQNHWFVASTMLVVNGKFRDGHAYQGLPGLLVAWFIGLYFFYVVFNYGIITTMILHTSYDLLVDVTHYVLQKIYP
jgi:hypothetical protein